MFWDNLMLQRTSLTDFKPPSPSKKKKIRNLTIDAFTKHRVSGAYGVVLDQKNCACLRVLLPSEFEQNKKEHWG